MRIIRTLLATGAASLLAFALQNSASAQVRINEMLFNPPGSDNGFEFFELLGPANFSLNGLWLIVIEGEGAGAGVVDQAINLTGFSLGSNGLFLQRDSATVLNPAPAPQTTVRISDFTPDIENGGQTYLLVSGFTGAVTNDLDTNNDGILDSMPWTSVLDAIAYSTDTPNPVSTTYASAFGGITFPQREFTPDAFYRTSDGFALVLDVLGTNPGPYNNDPAEIILADGTIPNISITLSPGSPNIALQQVPEPSTGIALLAGAGMATFWLRRRRSAK